MQGLSTFGVTVRFSPIISSGFAYIDSSAFYQRLFNRLFFCLFSYIYVHNVAFQAIQMGRIQCDENERNQRQNKGKKKFSGNHQWFSELRKEKLSHCQQQS